MYTLDSTAIPWRSIILGFTIANFCFETYVSFRQINVLKARGDQVPIELEPFKSKINEKRVKESKDYSVEKLQFSTFSGIYSTLLNVGFIAFDVLPKIWDLGNCLLSKLISSPFIGQHISNGLISQSLAFLGVYSTMSTLIGLPIAWYRNFVLEEKYGFNKLTYSLWISDTVKGFLLTQLIGGPLIGGFLWIIDWFGKEKFVNYVTGTLFVVQLLAIVIYPKFIQPLFNKLDALPDGELKTEIESLAKSNGFPLGELWVIDGSKRSGHSNAYFMGLPFGPGIKQIVLYDTLIHHSTIPEIKAVLGHEIGHWALGHTVKLMAISMGHIWMILSAFRLFIDNKSLYSSFGFNTVQPVTIGFILFSDILTPLEALTEFAMHYMTRKYEYEADRYAVEQGMGKELESALVNLHTENLSAFVVDPLFSAKEHSHPTLVERVSRIDALIASGVGKKLD